MEKESTQESKAVSLFRPVPEKMELVVVPVPIDQEAALHSVLVELASADAPKVLHHSKQFQLFQEILDYKLEHRPEKEELLTHNIIKSSGVAPILQARQEAVKFQNIVSTVTHKLQNRPNKETLVVLNIIKVEDGAPSLVAPRIRASQQSLKFKQSADKLNHKLGCRPPLTSLLNTNIIKGYHFLNRKEAHTIVCLENHPTIQAIQQSLQRRKVHDTLDYKLEHRPPMDQLRNANIIINCN